MITHQRPVARLYHGLILAAAPAALAALLAACSVGAASPAAQTGSSGSPVGAAAGAPSPGVLASIGIAASTAPSSGPAASAASSASTAPIAALPTPAGGSGGGRYGTGPTPKPSPKPAPKPTPGHTPKPSATLVIKAGSTSLGTVLVDANGLTLYVYASDSANHSNCTGGCASAWPPLLVKAGTKVSGGSGVHGHFATFKRSDGTTQVSYNGKPLYGWTGDSQPGDTTGQGVGGFTIAKV